MKKVLEGGGAGAKILRQLHGPVCLVLARGTGYCRSMTVGDAVRNETGEVVGGRSYQKVRTWDETLSNRSNIIRFTF